MDLSGRVGIVTGAARGIGRAYADALAKAGAALVIADILEEEGRSSAEAIRSSGGKCIFVPVDVTDVRSTEELAQRTTQEYGRLDILVNNAAMFAGLGQTPLTELPEDRWQRVMDVNVKGVWLCIRAAVPHMRATGGGAIVNQSSVAAYALHSGPFLDYATSKAAVIGLTKSAAKELAADNIRVNAICPGGVATESALGFTGGDRAMIDEAARRSQLIPAAIEPADMAGPMLFLVTESSKHMTGQTLVYDGGRFFLG